GGIMNNVVFVTKNTNNIYKLELSKTLLHFIEYDFTYFWEQCIALGKLSRRTGEYGSKQFIIIKNLITKCHPYFEAQINADFEYIVLDCIIEYICHSENIGLEELWARCISPKNAYEKAIFSRISEYKTNRAINQWANIMRIQEYAKNKVAYIFDGVPTKKNNYKTRKNYFDLTFSVAARELGFPSADLPSTQRFSAALMPNSPFMISKISKGILKRISDIIDNVSEPLYSNVTDCLRDQIGLDIFGYIKQIPRPEELEIKTAAETFQDYADEIYFPNSFKAVIDLEFDKMLDEGILFQHCEKCGKYFIQEMNYRGKYCNRVNASGLTCREQVGTERDELPQKSGSREERCEKLSEAFMERIGLDFDENEYKEWFQYLENMKTNVKNDNATPEDLDAFLDYSEKMYGEVRQGELRQRPTRSAVVPKVKSPEKPVKKRDLEPKPYIFPTLEELNRR
ncbi:MAG: DUF6076 domain-containing protein, partial [Oscillospiraceae bacterium]